MRAYISGAISSLDYKEAFENFEAIEEKLKAIGVTKIFNPMREVDPTLPYRTQMEICLNTLRKCDCVFFQKNWKESPGAREEFTEAMRLRIVIRYDRDNDYRDIEKNWHKILKKDIGVLGVFQGR